MKMNDAEFQKLQAEHGDLKKVEHVLGTIVVRGPTRFEYRTFRDKLSNDKASKFDITERLAIMCSVWPSKEELNAIIEKKPGIVERIANAALELGAVVESDEGKE